MAPARGPRRSRPVSSGPRCDPRARPPCGPARRPRRDPARSVAGRCSPPRPPRGGGARRRSTAARGPPPRRSPFRPPPSAPRSAPPGEKRSGSSCGSPGADRPRPPAASWIRFRSAFFPPLRGTCTFRAIRLEAPELPPERVAPDAEDLGRPADPSVAGLQDREHVAPLHLVQGEEALLLDPPRWRADLLGQVPALDDLAGGENGRVLHGVRQLPD